MTSLDSPEALRVALGARRVVCDVAATKRAYARIGSGSPERCGCDGCRNFISVRGQAYPDDVQRVLEGLGVEPGKESEIYECCPLPDGRFNYGGFYHVVGCIEGERGDGYPLDPLSGTLALERISECFSAGFSTGQALVPEAFDGLPVVQLEFFTDVPWVLDRRWWKESGEEPAHE